MSFSYKDEYIMLGLNIAYYRKLNGFTQEKLADALNIERAHIGGVETARVGVSLDVIFGIAKILDMPAYKLFEFRN